MVVKDKRLSGGAAKRAETAKLQEGLPQTAEEYLELNAEQFAIFLVGKTLEVVDNDLDEPLRVTGIVRRVENSEKDAEEFAQDSAEITDSNWQVSIMSAEKRREYTFCVLDFVRPDGKPYQSQRRAGRGEDGVSIVHLEKKVTMTIKDYENKNEASVLFKDERHFLGGCAAGIDILKQGIQHMKTERVQVWWPGERSWFPGRVAATVPKGRCIEIAYDDGEAWPPKPYGSIVWRLEGTDDTFENGKKSIESRRQLKASGTRNPGAKAPKNRTGQTGKETKKRKPPGKQEYKAFSESLVIDDGNLVVKMNGDQMLRLVDTELPSMSKKNKLCRVETPIPECAIFTIQESAKKPKHIVNIVAPTFTLHSPDMTLYENAWRLDWGMQPKAP